MGRVQLFELEDQSWFPAPIREAMTDFLSFVGNLSEKPFLGFSKKLGAAIPADKLARLAGTYAGQGVGEATVEFKEGKIFLRAMGGSNEMLAYDELSFAVPAMQGMRFDFVLEGEKAKSMRLSGNGMNAVLNRVEGK